MDTIERMINETIKENSGLSHIRNIVNVYVDGLKCVNHYKIQAMYNKLCPDGHCDLFFKTIDEFDMTWDEIEHDGGISAINTEIKNCYKVA